MAIDASYGDEIKSRKCDLCANAPYHWDEAGGGRDLQLEPVAQDRAHRGDVGAVTGERRGDGGAPGARADDGDAGKGRGGIRQLGAFQAVRQR